ncbi:MAG TPA: alpha/beta hydrolase [Terriglobales bacterium]|nr:alpha/beta hydrolase [Terriglobales bacterium]
MKTAYCLLLAALYGASTDLAQTAPPNPPGKLVDIGGYRLHLNCTGKGSSTVLLEYGASGNSMVWSLVQHEVAQFARVCSYDRAYEGWSDAGPGPMSMHQQVYELHTLLRAAHVDPPYILVGWSLGGMIDRLYTDQYPQEVSGMVLVDATHEDIPAGDKPLRERFSGKPIPPIETMQSNPPVPLTSEDQKRFEDWKARKLQESKAPPEYPWSKLSPHDLALWRFADMNAKPIPRAKGDQAEWLSEEFQQIHDSRQNHPHPLGNIPLIVLAAGKGARNAHEPARALELKDMETLSTNSAQFIDESSGHGIPLENPELVTHSVQDVIHAAKTNTHVHVGSTP